MEVRGTHQRMSSLTDDIKSRLDIVSYIQQVVPLKKAGRTYKACCPFHAEKTPSFNVDPDKQTWRCFGACAEGGDIFNFAMKYHGWDFKDALHHLADLAGVQVKPQTPEQKQKQEHIEKLWGLLETAADTYHTYLMESQDPAVQAVRDYAHNQRGLSDETLRTFKIGYAPDNWRGMMNQLLNLGYSEADIIEAGLAINNQEKHSVYDRFRDRLMIPIRNERKRVVGFGGRAMSANEQAKYINSPQSDVFNKSNILFGLDTARHAIRETETVVIVEGYLDAIQAQQAGYMNVVAQMGTSLTEAQLQLVSPRHAKKIVMALDSDSAGQNATRRSLETARKTLQADYTGRLSVDIRVLQMPGAKDPDDLIRENPDQWPSLVDAAVPIADFVIRMETADLPPDASVQTREEVARRVLPLLTASENNLYTQDNVQKLALKLRIPERDLLAWARSTEHEEAKKRSAQTQAARPATSEDEPPPLDIDALEPPDWDEMPPAGFEPETAPGGLHGLPAVETPEMRCLRGLLLNPETLYEINRKFRELAGEDSRLLGDSLADLNDSDFVQIECRMVMQRYLSALEQYEHETLDYIQEHASPVERELLKMLHLHDMERVQGRLRQRFGSDLAVMWKTHERRGQPPDRAIRELMVIALGLRSQRLKRNLDDLRFQQKEAQMSTGDDAIVEQMGVQIGLAMRALRLLDNEAQRQKSVMTF